MGIRRWRRFITQSLLPTSVNDFLHRREDDAVIAFPGIDQARCAGRTHHFFLSRTPGRLCGVLVHPVLHLPWIIKATTVSARRGWAIVTLAAMIIGVFIFGWVEWPKPTNRHLSIGTKESIASYISRDPFAHQRIAVDFTLTDTEAEAYAEDFVAALEHGYWNVQPPFPVAVISDRPFSGIQIWYDDSNEVAAKALVDALRKAEVKAVDLRRMPANSGLSLMVGPKP